ncbi:Kelch repeat and BTB domain-containing protein 7 [Mizuhopecten yessoensis]|uniref:Kelch repeat and BTB domain-containing protein 7 n=1 Tax=Mizuhopecten yessoensis TaxID=6573 RepID=A0A210Q3L3_MIZYE|nr:Kelch repeat and BTB domain-containing protein 7 [Mizuhopecten yessoensis]
MSSMNYQKVYMNQIHSSSLLCQLSHMWKGQMLCDAIIKTGQVITKAHRVVLVAACPMLQSMENASAGSHLEVRLAADIKQESVNTFLQYLYEGFMMLTEENVRDVEKVGRLLQVDSVIKCCADFYKCMNAKTGAPFPGSSYKYSFSGHDLAEFRHVRATGLQKTASERIIKRVSDFPRPGSPGSKRPRLYRGGSPSDVTVIGSDKADDTASMSHSYMSGAPDPWDRVPKLGSGMSRQGATGRNSQPGVIEIIEERIELVQTEPPEKDSGQPSSSRSSQKSAAVSIAVTSQFNTEPDISVVNVFGSPETQSTTAASNAITSSSSSRGSITVSPLTIFQEPHPQSSSAPEPSSSSSTVESSGQVSEIQFAGFSQRQDVVDSVYGMGKQQKSVDSQLTSTPHQRPFPVSVSPITQPKPFAAGSAVQAGISSPSSMSLPLGSPSSSKSVQKPRSAPASPAERARDSRRASEAAGMHSTADMTPDLSIVKIESSNHETGGLDMHVDMPEEGVMRIHPGRMPDEQEEASDKEIEDWAREEMSNEGSNISGDQNNSWYMGTFKDTESGLFHPPFSQSTGVDLFPPLAGDLTQHIPVKNENNKYTKCFLCLRNKTKTKSGWRVNTYYKCSRCSIPLCNNRERNCFETFHRQLLMYKSDASQYPNQPLFKYPFE